MEEDRLGRVERWESGEVLHQVMAVGGSQPCPERASSSNELARAGPSSSANQHHFFGPRTLPNIQQICRDGRQL